MTILGNKRTCVGCLAKFYDLGKNPAKCPKCGTQNDSTIAYRKRGRKVAAPESDDPLAKEKAKMETRQAKAKKPVKQIEGVDLDEFEDIEPIGTDDDIEEIEEDDMEIESLEEIEEEGEDDIEEEGLEEDELGDEVLIDDIDDEDEEDEDDDDDDDDDDDRPARGKKPAKKPAAKPAAKAPAKKPAPKTPAKKPVAKAAPAKKKR